MLMLMLLHHRNNRCVKIETQKRRETKPDAPRARRPIFLCLDFRVVRNIGEGIVGGQRERGERARAREREVDTQNKLLGRGMDVVDTQNKHLGRGMDARVILSGRKFYQKS